MWKPNGILVAVLLSLWVGGTSAWGQTMTGTRIEGMSIGATGTQRGAGVEVEDFGDDLFDSEDPLEAQRQAQEALLEEQRLQRMAETQRLNSIRRGVLAITQDENLAEVMAHSSLTLAELEELLSRYDWSANLEAEQMRARRMQETMRQAGGQDYWSSESVSAHDFPLRQVSQKGDTVTGYVENRSQKGHERFRMECRIRAADGSESSVESEYVERFEVGERRLIRFKIPWNDKSVTNVVITGCRAFTRPSAP